jgi:hypothetical protein
MILRKYQKGTTALETGVSQNGLNLNAAFVGKDPHIINKFNTAYNGKDFSGSYTNVYRTPEGSETHLTASYHPNNGITGVINQGYNFQLGKTNLRAGQGRFNIMPYVGTQLSAPLFSQDETKFNNQKNTLGKERGVFHGGLDIFGQLQLWKDRRSGSGLSLNAGAGLQVARAGKHYANAEEKQGGAGDIVNNPGYNKTGFNFVPSAQASLRYTFGNKKK